LFFLHPAFFVLGEQSIQFVAIKRQWHQPHLQSGKGIKNLCFHRNQEKTMISKSKLAMIAAVAAITLASPAFAQSIPGYAADGSVVALGRASNAQQKADKTVGQRSRSFGSATNDSGIPGYGPDGDVVTLGQ
jgi:hypothetical protein